MNRIADTRFAQLVAPLVALTLALLLGSSVTWAQTTSYTYQGRLTDSSLPANGSYEFQFKLFDALSAGNQIGAANSPPAILVSNGVFTTTLDFGAAAFPGANRWLEIAVRPAGVGSYTTLAPRQPITSTPYAIKSLNAGAADSLSAACAGCVTAGQINNINSSQINGTITGSQITVPLSLTGNSASPILTATNNGAGEGLRGVSASGTAVVALANGTTGFISGVEAHSASTSGRGIYGWATAATGFTDGVFGLSASTSGRGVNGFASSTTGATNGVRGQSDSNAGRGVYGVALNTAGTTYGVYGESASSTGRGVYGIATSTTGSTYGAVGFNVSSSGTGVLGQATSTTGFTFGVVGLTASSDGRGVRGWATSTTGVTEGVHGESASSSGSGVLGFATSANGTTFGVQGQSASSSGRGVFGLASSTTGVATGVRGESASSNGFGVLGRATSTTGQTNGVFGQSDSSSGTAVSAYAGSTTGTTYGVYGTNLSSGGYAVVGVATNTSGTNYGVYGGANSATGYAGYFNGRVNVTGLLSKGGGSFKIDHPLDPENKYLYHSFVESPEMMNIYNGNATTDANGEVEIEMPDYFSALNRDFRYQLTVIGQFAQAIVAEKIKDNRFKIRTSAPNVEVSWQVTGVRQDAFANKNRIPVEEQKPEKERGSYLHPAAFGQPEEKSVEWMRQPEMMKRQKEERERAQRQTGAKPANNHE